MEKYNLYFLAFIRKEAVYPSYTLRPSLVSLVLRMQQGQENKVCTHSSWRE